MTVSEFPLHDAAKAGDLATVNKIVDSTEDLNQLDDAGRTPLHYAVENNEAMIGSYFAECGANVNIKDKEGMTPLLVGAKHKRRLLVSMLLWAEAERDAVDANGNTALHWAAMNNDNDVAWLMCENQGEVCYQMKNKDGKTPLDIAKEMGHKEVANLIVDQMVDYEKRLKAALKKSEESDEAKPVVEELPSESAQ